MRFNPRKHKIKQIKSWLENSSESYSKPIDESALDSLSLNQATAVLSLVAKTYSAGRDDARKFYRGMRESKSTASLQLVQGGAM